MNIIVDLDRTLADDSHRKFYIESDPKNWGAYWEPSECYRDPPNMPVITVLQAIRAMYPSIHILIVTGRTVKLKKITMRWLMEKGVMFDGIFMRDEDDHSPSEELKAKFIDEVLEVRYKGDETLFVLDDRAKDVRMWRDRGFTCFQVMDGDF